MRGQTEPPLAFGNYPAARRYVRGRKPPPIILWCIGIITCLLFLGAAAMLAIGYLNPFGTVGLAILGVGAVVYFGAILFLVLSCLWVERKYPGMPSLSFKIYSKKPNRMPPTAFTNPNISGQMPGDTTPSYRTHNELPIPVPGISDVKGKTDKPKEKKDDNQSSHEDASPSQADNSKGQFTALDILQEEDHNGDISENDRPDIRQQAQTNHDDVNTNEHPTEDLISAAGTEEKSQSQEKLQDEAAVETVDQNKTAQHEQSQNDNSVPAPSRERKVKFKTHHIEVPFEDYPTSDSSTSLSKKKDKSQEPNSKNNFQQIKSTTATDNSPITGASKSASPTKLSAMDKQKETSGSSDNLTHTKDNNSDQRTKIKALSTAIDIKQGSSSPSSTQKSRVFENNETLQDGFRPPSSSKPAASSPASTRKPLSGQHQNKQESPQKVRSTNSASPTAFRKTAERESQASKPTNSVQRDFVLTSKSSPISARKLLDVHKMKTTNLDHTQESVREKSQASSLSNTGENMLPHRNNLRHDQQNMQTSPKHRKQNPESPGGSPTRAQKMQSPERAHRIRKDNAASNSPVINKKADGSSTSPSHHQKKPEDSSKAQEQSITIQTLSSSGKKEEIQGKKIAHSSPSSQSSDFPSSSSPPRQRQRSPNKSPRLQKTGDHTSSLRNKDFSNRQNRQTSPSSQSRDIPTSPSSSPQRNQRKSPVLSNKIQSQSHKEIPVTTVVSSSANKKDELHKKLSQQSSQSSDVSSSPTSSPLNATKLLHYKKEQANQHNENKSVPQPRTNK